MGRVRAVLRLGERADARAPRRAVLAPGRVRSRRAAGARARMRHGTRVAAARARGHRSRRDRSVRADARTRTPADQAAPHRKNGGPRTLSSAPTSATFRLVRGSFPMVLAPYGILQSLIRPRDLRRRWPRSRVSRAGRTFGIDLVPDVPNWREYANRVQLRGKAGGAPSDVDRIGPAGPASGA